MESSTIRHLLEAESRTKEVGGRGGTLNFITSSGGLRIDRFEREREDYAARHAINRGGLFTPNNYLSARSLATKL